MKLSFQRKNPWYRREYMYVYVCALRISQQLLIHSTSNLARVLWGDRWSPLSSSQSFGWVILQKHVNTDHGNGSSGSTRLSICLGATPLETAGSSTKFSFIWTAQHHKLQWWRYSADDTLPDLWPSIRNKWLPKKKHFNREQGRKPRTRHWKMDNVSQGRREILKWQWWRQEILQAGPHLSTSVHLCPSLSTSFCIDFPKYSALTTDL